LYQDLWHKQTETTHQQRVGRSESHSYWMFCLASGVVPTCLCSCWRRIFWAHAVIRMMWC